MATINGFTAAHMQAIKNGTISSAALGGASGYDLVFTKYDNTTLNVGNVRGATGQTGTAATIAVGTVTTGSAGSSATVTNAGSSSAAVFNFSIPQGTNGTGLIVCTSSTRPASPTVGQNIYETDTGKHLVYYGATTLWRQPWNMPWGFVASGTSTATITTSTTTGTEVGLANTSTFTAVANRNYLINVTSSTYGTQSGDLFVLRARNNSISGTQLGIINFTNAYSGGTGYMAVTLSVVSTIAAGSSAGIFVTATRSSGTGTTTFNHIASPVYVSIADIGPSTSTPPSP